MDFETFRSHMERYERFHGRFGGPGHDGSLGPSRRETFQELLDNSRKAAEPQPVTVTLTDADLAKIRSGLAQEIVDLQDARARDGRPETGPVT